MERLWNVCSFTVLTAADPGDVTLKFHKFCDVNKFISLLSLFLRDYCSLKFSKYFTDTGIIPIRRDVSCLHS